MFREIIWPEIVMAEFKRHKACIEMKCTLHPKTPMVLERGAQWADHIFLCSTQLISNDCSITTLDLVKQSVISTLRYSTNLTINY